MLNWPWPCTVFFFGLAWVPKLVVHNLIEGFDWSSYQKKVCFVQGQGQKYGQKHQTKELVEFHNHFHALTVLEIVETGLRHLKTYATFWKSLKLIHSEENWPVLVRNIELLIKKNFGTRAHSPCMSIYIAPDILFLFFCRSCISRHLMNNKECFFCKTAVNELEDINTENGSKKQ